MLTIKSLKLQVRQTYINTLGKRSALNLRRSLSREKTKRTTKMLLGKSGRFERSDVKPKDKRPSERKRKSRD